MNRVKPLSFTTHVTITNFMREKSELMKRMLDIDKAITNLISEVGYKIEVDEVEKYLVNIQREHVLRISKSSEVRGEVLGVGAFDANSNKWTFIKDSSLKDPMLIASVECLIERNQFLSSLTDEDTVGVFYFSRETKPKGELELLKGSPLMLTPEVPEQPTDRVVAKDRPKTPTPAPRRDISDVKSMLTQSLLSKQPKE